MTKAVVEYPANLSSISVISEAIFQHTSRWDFASEAVRSVYPQKSSFLANDACRLLSVSET